MNIEYHREKITGYFGDQRIKGEVLEELSESRVPTQASRKDISKIAKEQTGL